MAGMEERIDGIVSQIRVFSMRSILVESQKREFSKLFSELVKLIGLERATECCKVYLTPHLRDVITNTLAAA